MSAESSKVDPLKIVDDQAIISTSTATSPPSGYMMIRKLLINSAVNFLNNPRLKLTSDDAKKAFLSKKGLTQDEIDLAFELSIQRPLDYSVLQKELDFFAAKDISIFRRSFNFFYQLLIWGGFFYGAYSLYQDKIRPYLYRDLEKPHPEKLIFEQINQLNEQIMELSRNVSIVHEFITTYCQLRDDSISKMKNELTSIKALLVNKNQFPSVPCIPEWQINSRYSDVTDDL